MEDKSMRFKEGQDGLLEIVSFLDIQNPSVLTKAGLVSVEIELENGDIYDGFVHLRDMEIKEEQKSLILFFENRIIELQVMVMEDKMNGKINYKNKK